jgi:hypothetical protein
LIYLTVIREISEGVKQAGNTSGKTSAGLKKKKPLPEL